MAIGDPPTSSKISGKRFASIGGVVINSYGMALEALRAAEQYFSLRSGENKEEKDGDDD